MKFKRFFLASILVCSCLTFSNALAWDKHPVSQREEEYLKNQYEFLKQQTIHHEDRVDKERENLYNQITTLIAVLGFIGLGSIGAFIATLYSLNRKAKKALEEHLRKNGKQIERNVEAWIKSRVGSELGFNKKIALVADQDRHRTITENELSLLRARGFRNIRLLPLDAEISSYDIVVFYYDTKFDDQLNKIIRTLENSKDPVPLVGYYSGRINNQKFEDYRWHTFANSPLTLISWIFTIASSFDNIITQEIE